MKAITNKIRRSLVNLPGWITNKKIVVIESDDWGSVRIPSKKVYEHLLEKNIPVDKNYFTLYDTLESEEDLSDLFEILIKYKDYHGNHPCITANTIVANPDFERIKNSNFNEFHYEPFWLTYSKYPRHHKSLTIWKDALKHHILWPQFHGRDHLNPSEYLKTLRSSKYEQIAFDQSAIIGGTSSSKRLSGFMAAFDYETIDEYKTFNDVIVEGQKLFEQSFGFKSRSFIAPTGLRSDSLDEVLAKNGIEYHQHSRQPLPLYEAKSTVRNRFWGSENDYGQIYGRRNGVFEPARNKNYDWVDSVLGDAKIAFHGRKPLVINSHRVNYVGGIDPKNKARTLKLLDQVFNALITKYPDILFLSSDQLGDHIRNSSSYFLGIKPHGKYYDERI